MSPSDPNPTPPAVGYYPTSDALPSSPNSRSFARLVEQWTAQFTRSARDHLLLLLLLFSLISAATMLVAINLQAVYTSTATVRIFRTPGKTFQFEDAQKQDIASAEDVNTQLGILNSIAIVQMVDERLKGDVRKAFLDPYFQVGASSAEDAPSVPTILMRNRKATPRRLTLIFDLKYEHPNPAIAATVANLFAEAYLDFNETNTVQASVKGLENLSLQARSQAAKIKEIELKLAEFKSRYDTTSFERAQDIKIKQLEAISVEVTRGTQELLKWRGIREQIESARKEGMDLWRVSAIAANPAVQTHLGRLAELDVQLSGLSQRYLRRHPRMLELQESIAKARRQLSEASQRTADSIVSDFERMRLEAERLREEETKKRQEYIRLDLVRPEYDALVRDLDINRQHYDYYYNRAQQLAVKVADEQKVGQIVDRALPSPVPSYPTPRFTIPMSVGAGLLSAFLVLAVLSVFDDRVRSPADIEIYCNTDVIGIVPQFPLARSKRIDPAYVLDGANRVLEVFSSTLAMLRLAEGAARATRLLVTSCEPAEGKSSIATALAVAFSVEGNRTLLVEGDLRQPSLRKSFPNSDRTRDINRWVENPDYRLADFIVRDPATGLDVLAFDRPVDNPLSVLASNRFTQAARELFSQYDRVIIDTPPVGLVPDALTLLPLTDGALFVLRYGKSHMRKAADAIARVRHAGRLLGSVVNGLSPRAGRKYYARYYRRDGDYYYQNQSEAAHSDTPSHPPTTI